MCPHLPKDPGAKCWSVLNSHRSGTFRTEPVATSQLPHAQRLTIQAPRLIPTLSPGCFERTVLELSMRAKDSEIGGLMSSLWHPPADLLFTLCGIAPPPQDRLSED